MLEWDHRIENSKLSGNFSILFCEKKNLWKYQKSRETGRRWRVKNKYTEIARWTIGKKGYSTSFGG